MVNAQDEVSRALEPITFSCNTRHVNASSASKKRVAQWFQPLVIGKR